MSNFKKYSDKGLNGLANLGNTCFLNSVIQCLAFTYELYDIEKDKKTDNVHDLKIFDEYFKLVHFMWDEDSTVSPNGFLKNVQIVAQEKGREMFTGFSQNDFSEFLLFLISCFHESIKESKDFKLLNKGKNLEEINCFFKNLFKNDYSKITDIFCGIQVNTIHSMDGTKLKARPEQFTILSLPIPDKRNNTLYDCIEEYLKDVELNGSDQYVLPKEHKDSGKKIDAIIQHNFFVLPKILILNILRVKITSNSIRKNEAHIHYDEEIDLNKYCSNNSSNIYDLYAVGEHHGNLMGGHYTCIVKNENGNWYRFNDMQVKKIDKIQTNRAYTFFYRKKVYE